MTTWESVERMMADCEESIATRRPHPVLGSGPPGPPLTHGERLLLAIGFDVFALRSSRGCGRADERAAPSPPLSLRTSRTWSYRGFTSKGFTDLGVV